MLSFMGMNVFLPPLSSPCTRRLRKTGNRSGGIESVERGECDTLPRIRIHQRRLDRCVSLKATQKVLARTLDTKTRRSARAAGVKAYPITDKGILSVSLGSVYELSVRAGSPVLKS